MTPDWRTVPSQLGAHQHCAGLITGQKLSNGEDGLLAEYVRIRDLDANAARIPPGVSWGGGCHGGGHAEHRPLRRPAGRRPARGHGGGHGRGACGAYGHCRGKAPGAGRILAIGSRPAGLALAQFYGATDLVNYKEGTSPGKSTCSPTSRAPTAASVPAAVPTPWGRLSPWSAGAAPWAM